MQQPSKRQTISKTRDASKPRALAHYQMQFDFLPAPENRLKRIALPSFKTLQHSAPKAVTSAGRKLLTIAEAADRARLSETTIQRAYLKGELRVFRTPLGGRVLIYADSLDFWIERNSYGGAR